MNRRELECLYRESEYYEEAYNNVMKGSVCATYIENNLNRFLIKNKYKCGHEDFNSIVASVKNSLGIS